MILITGGNGQVGQCFQDLAARIRGPRFIFVDVQELDITNRGAVQKFFKKNAEISWVVNLAAYTAVDKAETDRDLAKKINVTGAKNLAEACAAKSIPFIHISTDYVYHNRQNTPFVEGDAENPKGWYAKTKLMGDRAALAANPATMILRTSWVYSAFGNNFVKTMLKYGRDRAEMRVVFDQIGTPTYAPDLVSVIMEIMESVNSGKVSKEAMRGIFHFSNEGVTSWFDFATAIFQAKSVDCRVLPIRSSEYPTPAARPPFSVLDKSKIKAIFEVEIAHWQNGLSRCLDILE
jgi:dTDP-4-dehydrorhamnose reductase